MDRHYVAPSISRTGCVYQQPRDEQLVDGFDIDANGRWTPASGALDAPEWIGTGSIRGEQLAGIVLGIANRRRGT